MSMSKRQKQMPVANTLCDMPENILERICSFLVPLDAFALFSTSKFWSPARWRSCPSWAYPFPIRNGKI